MRLAVVSAGLIFAVVSGLALWRAWNHRADRAEMARLSALQPSDPVPFRYDMIAGLPEPAQRFFRFSIAEGTPLLPVVTIRMHGRFSIGNKDAPNDLAMQATQILAAPEGFIWKVKAGAGVMRLSGSDSAKWTRFWIGSIWPVARRGGDADHRRAAFGRYVAEAVFWSPAAVLPGPNVRWQAVDEDTARVTVHHADLTQSVDLTVSKEGQPTQIVFDRWSDANPRKTYQFQPFGGTFSAFQDFQGYRLPTRVAAGNFFGTDEYFAFYHAEVDEISFPARSP
ncbi:DUF6544 family protein [uncultured Sulfitobacter sp.]|uniref:DUF6544 family protein n=1 Tax=uncultured Sulfitobacter sp. TaxID=191468 RepID=UPI002611A55D|nr:DUF6544 family protein [uncultured Sulfitobacter sp.]